MTAPGDRDEETFPMHSAPTRPRPRTATRPALALGTVAGVLTAIIATGTAAGAHEAPRVAAVGSVAAAHPSADPAAARAAMVHALRVTETTAPASRSQNRAPLRHNAGPGHAAPTARQWVRPNAGPLTSPFGYRWGRLHAGIDLAGPYGSPILAATDGCITYAGPMAGYGEVMQIRDWDGTETVYGHMSAFVRTSGCVKAGQLIARVGSAGDATGPHLHFEVRIGGTPVDPIPFLAKRGVAI